MDDDAPFPFRRVHVIGAGGRSGTALSRALVARGAEVVPVVRDPARWAATGLPGEARVATIEDGAALREALRDAAAVVSTVHARHVQAVIAAAPETARLLFLGSTRRFTRWPDAHGDGVIAGEAALMASGRRGIMLHPTMIYGAQGENNVRRLATILRRLPVVPLPGGGRALVQPIHQDDLTRAMLAALVRDWGGPRSLVVAGPDAVPYREFVRAVAAAAGIPARPTVSVPVRPLILLAAAARPLPFLPRIGPDEIRRLTEDKAFDVAPMRALLGVEPISLDDGLRLTFEHRKPGRFGEEDGEQHAHHPAGDRRAEP